MTRIKFQTDFQEEDTLRKGLKEVEGSPEDKKFTET